LCLVAAVSGRTDPAVPRENSTIIAAGISGFEVTGAVGRGCGRGCQGLGGDAICAGSSDQIWLPSWDGLHSRAVSRVCGRGGSGSPSTAVVCPMGRLNLLSADGSDAAANGAQGLRRMPPDQIL